MFRAVYFCAAMLCTASFVFADPTAFISNRTLDNVNNRSGAREHYGDPPAPPGWILFSPRLISNFGNYSSVQVNVNSSGNNIVGDAANEPSLCVDPTNGNRIAVGWRQFNSVTSNFRQAGYAYSSNGGASWTFPGVLENNVFRSDPVLQSDANGKFYYLSLMQTFYDDIWTSTNGGANWTRVAAADGGDKQWFTIDRTNSIGSGNLYQDWSTAGNNYNGRQFTRSTNSGLTWMNPINLPNSPIWGTLDVGSNGDLYIGAEDGNTGNNFWFLRSTNAKNAAVTPTFDRVTAVNLGGKINDASTINPQGLTGQCWIAADRSSGTFTAGNIYMLCSVSANGTSPTDVKFVRSTDAGLSWSSPYRINDDAVGNGRWHWFGTLAVSPNGRIDTVWLDTRNDASEATSALYYCYSYDGGVTWAPNIRVSQSFNQSIGYPNQDKMGDYIGMVSDNGGADVAYTATFNNEEDVYFLRIAAIPVVISGTVNLLDWNASRAGQHINILIRNVGSATPIVNQIVTLDANGNFTLSLSNGIAPGNYDISAQGTHWLRKKLTNVPITYAGASGLSFTLTNGDVNGSNSIDDTDLLGVINDFLSTPGSHSGNPNTDLNGDGAVNDTDLLIVINNFLKIGDN